MFGWKISPQQPRDKLIEALAQLLSDCDFAVGNTNAQSLTKLQQEIETCGKLVAALDPTEQSKISLYWTGGVESFNNTLNMYNAKPQIKLIVAKPMLPGVKTHILNTINALS